MLHPSFHVHNQSVIFVEHQVCDQGTNQCTFGTGTSSAAALNRTEDVTRTLEAIAKEEPGVSDVITVNG